MIKRARILPQNQESGMILAIFVVTLTVFMTFVTSVLAFGISNFNSSKRTLIALDALTLAEAGVDSFMYNINRVSDYAGSGGEFELYNDNVKGKGTYETTVQDGAVTGEKIITATGRIYLPQTATSPRVTRKLRVTIQGSEQAYSYSIQTGPGGLYLQNSATITNGQVRVNGLIDMQNSARIGSASNPLEVWAADISCPTSGGASYPELCDSAHKSIAIRNTAHIYANVHKKNTVDNGSITGTIDEIGADPVSLPDDDRPAVKTAIENTGTTMTAAAASCNGSETRTWGNVHISGGDVTVTNSCVVTITGNVWIDGGLTLSNSGELKVSNTLVSAPTIMIDGSGGLSLQNQSKILQNSDGIATKIIAFYCGSGCSPDSTPTGNTLFNAQSNKTIVVNNQSAAAGSVLYARWGEADLQNGGAVGALVGQKVRLQNSGNITFGVSLGFGSGGVFTVKYYQQVAN